MRQFLRYSPMRTLLVFVGLLLWAVATQAQAPRTTTLRDDDPLVTTRILFLLDASGSMLGTWQNNSRWNVARRLLTDLMDSLEGKPRLEVALRVYGHQTERGERDCKDTRLEVPFAPGSFGRIQQKLKNIKPLGNTPIAYSMSQAAFDFPKDPFSRNILILITDGQESCDGDPCQVSYQLQKQHIFLKPFIIGLGLDLSMKQAFNCVGTYFDAEQEVAFKQALDLVVAQALNSTTLQLNLTDQFMLPTESNVAVTFYDSELGIERYNFIHTLNSRKLSDTLLIDPANSYDIVVHSNPEVRKERVKLLAGKHNVVTMHTPMGGLELVVNGVTGYRNLKASVRESKSGNYIGTQDFNTVKKYLTGSYELEILTTPITRFSAVEIRQGETVRLQIPQPGLVNVASNTEGYGSIFSTDGPRLVKVHDLNPATLTETVVLQPGNYKVVFRSKNSTRAVFSLEKEFTVSSGAIITVRF
jgi:Ca-activated chloride channel homolog